MARIRNIIIGSFFVIGTLLCSSAFAETVNDDFQTGKIIESRYFKIFIERGVDLQELGLRLSIPSSLKAIIKEPVSIYDSYDLSDKLDLLFLPE